MSRSASQPNVRNRSLIGAAMIAVLAPAAFAQGALATEGAAFLLVPVGARAAALGQAGTSTSLGPEGAWWNPASLGWLTARDIAVDFSQLEFITSNAAAFVQPLGRAGVLGFSGLYFNLGNQDATDNFGNVVGRLYPKATVVQATYAAPFGDRVSAGVAFKRLVSEQSCTGACQQQTLYRVSAYAFDFGLQIVADSARRLTAGAMLKHVGTGLQTIDAEQTDPLPTRLHLGATYSRPAFGLLVAGTSVGITGEFVLPPADLSRGDLRVGVEARFADRVSLRAGIPTVRWGEEVNGSGDGSKAVMGIGIRQGTLSFDLGRAFLGTSAAAGKPATYVSFRVMF